MGLFQDHLDALHRIGSLTMGRAALLLVRRLFFPYPIFLSPLFFSLSLLCLFSISGGRKRCPHLHLGISDGLWRWSRSFFSTEKLAILLEKDVGFEWYGVY